jgi:3-hydroxyacyl-[acyl-carrier-protein] dehydratase
MRELAPASRGRETVPGRAREPGIVVTPPFGQDVIRTILPHRHPFLLLDRVEELEPERRIVCVKSLTDDDYYLFRPDRGAATFPVSLLVEVVAQTGALLVLLRPGLEGRRIFFMTIDSFELDRPLAKGETVTVEAETVRLRRRFGTLRGVARVGDEEVARGLMRFAMEVPEAAA